MNLTSIESAIEMLKNGKVGVLPTDTLYGLVACAGVETSVTHMYALKQRESKPGTLIAANVQQLIDLGLEPSIVNAVAYLWPNPLSIVLPVKGLDYLHQGAQELAVRVVADPIIQNFLLRTGPLMTSSANSPGEANSNTINMAQEYFGSSVDFYVDGGDLSDRKPSTIVSIKDGKLIIYRIGALTEADLNLLLLKHR